MSARSVALDHYRARQRLVRAVASEAARLWRQVDLEALDASWSARLTRMMVALAGAQRAAAQAADGYLAEVLEQQGLRTAAAAALDPAAFAGTAADGRALDALLHRPVIATKTAIAAGQPLERAFATGMANLDLIVRTETADAGRLADQVSLTAHRGADGYVRMLVGKSCPRCAILAGKRYGWNAGFRRHPRCDCIHIPAREDSADDLRTDPKAYFQSLSRDEQDRLFTKAGAEAIREGADIGRVVNSGRGMYAAGGRSLTREATTRRGTGQRIRLTPAQIFREANGNRDETLRLLRLHGYLI